MIHENYQTMTNERYFLESPLLSFQRNKSLRDILINSDIESEVPHGKSMPSNHPNYMTCKSMSKTDKSLSPSLEGLHLDFVLPLT